MIPVERRLKIVNLVTEHGVISITELKNKLDVSLVTLRRDLKILQNEGKITSVFGGVQATNKIKIEPDRSFFENRANAEKDAIANLALDYIEPGSCIYLDAGTTTLALARKITNREDLTVITNDFYIVSNLINNSKCKIIFIGGKVNNRSNACFGDVASQTIYNYNIDVAFVSSTSWSTKGIMTSVEEKVAIKRALKKQANTLILLCDSTKFGLEATYIALPIKDFDIVITDKGLSTKDSLKIEQDGVRLYKA